MLNTKERGSLGTITLYIYIYAWEAKILEATETDYTLDLFRNAYEWDWEVGYCRVSTEIYVEDPEGGDFVAPITVEWNTIPPIIEDIWEDDDSKKIIVSKEGTATLTTIVGPGGKS